MLLQSNAVRIPLADESVQCCITSPPYWGLRSYLPTGHPDKALEIGTEPTPELYVEHMVAVFREVRRVLRDDGVLWLNLGDSYANASGGTSGGQGATSQRHGRSNVEEQRRGICPDSLKPKDLVGIPWRVAFALQADGWWLRSDIIWHKPNAMPESVTDRPTKAHEYIFLLTKSARYFYDAEAVSVPVAAATIERLGQATLDSQAGSSRIPGKTNGPMKAVGNAATRNIRTVWTIPTRGYKKAHFATFPPNLVRPMVLAGCPVGGTVLDPFCGTATVGQVCVETGREFVGLDLNARYLVEMALPRVRRTQPALMPVV